MAPEEESEGRGENVFCRGLDFIRSDPKGHICDVAVEALPKEVAF